MITIFQFRGCTCNFNEATEVKISDSLLHFIELSTPASVVNVLQIAHRYNCRLAEEVTTFSDLDLHPLILEVAEQLRNHEVYRRYFWALSDSATDTRLQNKLYKARLLNTVMGVR